MEARDRPLPSPALPDDRPGPNEDLLEAVARVAEREPRDVSDAHLDMLEESLGYRFRRRDLLRAALTHQSAPCVREGVNDAHNERLEYLGDAITGAVVATVLCERMPNLREGDLTRLRGMATNWRAQAEIAARLEIGSMLRVSPSVDPRTPKLAADALEAVVGACYLDGGWEPARDLVVRLYLRTLLDLEAAPPTQADENPRAALNRLCRDRNLPHPVFQIVARTGSGADLRYRAVCLVGAGQRVEALGRTSGEAIREAARAMLDRLARPGESPPNPP